MFVMFHPQDKPSAVGRLGQWANAYVILLAVTQCPPHPPPGSHHSAFLRITCESVWIFANLRGEQ